MNRPSYFQPVISTALARPLAIVGIVASLALRPVGAAGEIILKCSQVQCRSTCIWPFQDSIDFVLRISDHAYQVWDVKSGTYYDNDCDKILDGAAATCVMDNTKFELRRYIPDNGYGDSVTDDFVIYRSSGFFDAEVSGSSNGNSSVLAQCAVASDPSSSVKNKF
jgi:hypothetical protein